MGETTKTLEEKPVVAEEKATEVSEDQIAKEKDQTDTGQIPRTVMNEKIEKKNVELADREAKLVDSDAELAKANAKIAELTPFADESKSVSAFLQKYPHKRQEMQDLYSKGLNPGEVTIQPQKPALDEEALAGLEHDPVFKVQQSDRKSDQRNVDSRFNKTDQNVQSVSNRLEEALFRIEINNEMNAKGITNKAVRQDLSSTIHDKIIKTGDQNWQNRIGTYIDDRKKELYEPIEKDVVDKISAEATAAEQAQNETQGLPPSAASPQIAMKIPDGLEKTDEEISKMTSDQFAEHMKQVEKVVPYIAKTEEE